MARKARKEGRSRDELAKVDVLPRFERLVIGATRTAL
jgi:hypothetical protein